MEVNGIKCFSGFCDKTNQLKTFCKINIPGQQYCLTSWIELSTRHDTDILRVAEQHPTKHSSSPSVVHGVLQRISQLASCTSPPDSRPCGSPSLQDHFPHTVPHLSHSMSLHILCLSHCSASTSFYII